MIDRFKCFGCGTESREPTICEGCGNDMVHHTPDTSFAIVTYRQGIVDRVIGPFSTVTEAEMFWRDVGSTDALVSTTYQVEIMSRPLAFKRGMAHD